MIHSIIEHLLNIVHFELVMYSRCQAKVSSMQLDIRKNMEFMERSLGGMSPTSQYEKSNPPSC